MAFDLTVRRATGADAGAVAALSRDAYDKYIARIGRKPEPMTADYDAILAQDEVWVAADGADIVAALILRNAVDHLLIWSIAVARAQQGQGLGRKLLALAEARARARGHAELRLYTNALMRENIALYERCGYAQTRREERADRVLIHMAKPVPTGI